MYGFLMAKLSNRLRAPGVPDALPRPCASVCAGASPSRFLSGSPGTWVQASLRRPSSARVASRGLWAADPTLTLPSNGNCSPPFPAGDGPPGPGSPSFATRACPSGMCWDPARRRLQGFERARLPPGRFRSMGKLVPHLRVSPGRVCRPTGRPMGPRSLLRLIGGSGLERP